MEIGTKNNDRNPGRFPVGTIVALVLALIAIIVVIIFHKTIRAPLQPEETDIPEIKTEMKISLKKNDAKTLPTEFSILEIGKESNKVIFKGYIVDAGGDVNVPDPKFWTIEIILPEDSKVKLIPYGGFYHDYRLFPLEKKTERRFNEQLKDWVWNDIWFLSLQKKEQPPILLRMNTPVVIEELYARLKVSEGNDKGAVIGRLYEGDTFTLHDEEFIVNAIKEDEVVILDNMQRFITLSKSK